MRSKIVLVRCRSAARCSRSRRTAAAPRSASTCACCCSAASGAEPTFQAWEAQLRREGVPYDVRREQRAHAAQGRSALQTRRRDRRGEVPGGDRGGRQPAGVRRRRLPLGAVAPKSGPCSTEYERTFHVRQISQYAYPEPGFGLNWPSSGGAFEGVAGRLTAAGESVFPYLRGPVSIGSGTWGYLATPLKRPNSRRS